MLTPDVERSWTNVRQTVLDCRRAVAWLAARPEVDADRLGIFGTSLGSFMGALVAAAEPRVHSACLLLGGGGLVDAYYDHPRAGWLAQACCSPDSKEPVKRQIAPVDPITCGERSRPRRC